MRILFITPFPPPMGGIANWSKMIINYINENVNDIEAKYINTAPKKRSADGRTIFDRIYGGFFSILRTTKELKKALKEFKPDVVHINTSGSLALFRDIKVLKILKKNNIKSILHLHFGRVPEILNINNFEKRLLFKSFSLVSKIITIDTKTYKAICEYYPEKVHNVANPINTMNMPSPKILIASKCSCKVTYLGWVIKSKGIEELLFSWDELIKSYPNWNLEIIGPYKDDYLLNLKKKYSLNNVTFIGELNHDEAMNNINESDIFILPSYTEGFPYVILEAMYLGKAIIATNVGAIPEMLNNNSAVVINPKSSLEIYENLMLLINNAELRCVLSKNARKKCEQYYLNNIVSKYCKVWIE